MNNSPLPGENNYLLDEIKHKAQKEIRTMVKKVVHYNEEDFVGFCSQLDLAIAKKVSDVNGMDKLRIFYRKEKKDTDGDDKKFYTQYYRENSVNNVRVFAEKNICLVGDYINYIGIFLDARPERLGENIDILCYDGFKEYLSQLTPVIIEAKPETLSQNIAILREKGISTIDNLNVCSEIIAHGTPEKLGKNIDILKECGISLVHDLASIEHVVCHANPETLSENIAILREYGFDSLDDLDEFSLIITNAIPDIFHKNIQMLFDHHITSRDELSRWYDGFSKANPKNLKLILDVGIINIDDFKELSYVLKKANPENLQAILDVGIKAIDDINALGDRGKNILEKANPENLRTILNKGITNIDDIKTLGDLWGDNVLEEAKSENLKLILDLGITDVDQIRRLGKSGHSLLNKANPENLRIIIDAGITSIDSIDILGNGLNSILEIAKPENLAFVLQQGIIDVSLLQQLKGVLQNAYMDNFTFLTANGIAFASTKIILQCKDVLALEPSVLQGNIESLTGIKISENTLLAYTTILAHANSEQLHAVCTALSGESDTNLTKKVLSIYQSVLSMNQVVLPHIVSLITSHDYKGMLDNYINVIKEKSKSLVSSDKIDDTTTHDSMYLDLLRYVYPAGEYGNHEKILNNCDDATDHISHLAIDRNGYPVTLSGITGHEVKPGSEENKTGLESYQKRVEGISNFIKNRGPHNQENLQDDYKTLIDGFKDNCHTDILGGFDRNVCTIEQKILICIVSDIYKDKKRILDGKYKFPWNMRDVILLYKYVYEVDFADYAQQSAADVTTYEDAVSQRYSLWRELGDLYGEGAKHVIDNYLIKALNDNQSFFTARSNALSHIFEESIEFKSNDKEAILNLLLNDQISDKKSVIKNKIQSVFTNKKYSDELKKSIQNNIRDFCDQEKNISYQKIIDAIETVLLPEIQSLVSGNSLDMHNILGDYLKKDINIITQEMSKYQEKKEEGTQASKRYLRGYFTKNQAASFARMSAHICLGNDHTMRKNSEYFEYVIQDEKTNKSVGMCMLLTIQATDDTRYLFFAPNPYPNLMSQVSAQKCYDYLYETITQFAQENNYDGVVVPSNPDHISGHCTNRQELVPLIKNSVIIENNERKNVDFGGEHKLGGNYSYKDGALIWRKKF